MIMGDGQQIEMKTGVVGLVNGNVVHCDMDIDHVEDEFRLTATQVQNIKVLLSTLSMLSGRVQVRNRLFEKVASIASRSDDSEAEHDNKTVVVVWDCVDSHIQSLEQEVFKNFDFFFTPEEAVLASDNAAAEQFKEANVAAGKTHERMDNPTMRRRLHMHQVLATCVQLRR